MNPFVPGLPLSPSPLLAALSALLSLAIAAVVLNRNPHRAENQAFFALVVLAILANLNAATLYFGETMPSSRDPQLKLMVAFGGLSMYAVALFAHAFPLNRKATRAMFWGLGLLAGAHVGITLTEFGSPVALWYSRAYFYLLAMLSIYYIWRNYRALETRSERVGLLVVQALILGRFLLSVATFGLVRAGAQPHHALLVLYLIITPPIFSALLAYGLLRFQLLGIRFFLSRSLAYFAVSTAALLLYIGLVSAFQYYLHQLLGIRSASIFATPLLLLLLLVAFHPVRLKVEQSLDRWLDRGFVRAREAVERYFARARAVLGLRALHRLLRETTRSLLPESRLALLMARPTTRLLSLDGLGRFLPPGWQGEIGTVTGELLEPPDPDPDEVIELPEGAALLAYFRETRRSYLQRTRQRPFPGDAPAVLKTLRVDLVVPFWREGAVDGVLLLQAPNADHERIRLLIEVARHLGLQLENTLLYQQAIEANEALTRSNRALEDTRLFLESLFESVPAGIAVVAQEGRIVKWNRGMERLTGIPREKALVSEDIITLLPGLGLQGEAAEAAQGFTTPLQRRLKIGSGENEVIVHLRLAMFRDRQGGLGGTVLILTDVTQQVSMQAALEESKRLAALGQFAAAMAHEIRTPMTSIQMNVQILAGKVELPPEDYEYFDIILTELERLNRTVGEILDFARPMRLTMAGLELADLVEEVVKGLYFLLAERGVEVEQEVPAGLTVQADGERLKQVLINLLDNASHAIEEKPGAGEETPGIIRVSARRMSQRHVPGIELRIQDNGCGIPEETLRHIFEPFYTTRPKGTGLGLAIAKKIVEAHAGELSAESEVGKGSTFILWLPLQGLRQVSG